MTYHSYSPETTEPIGLEVRDYLAANVQSLQQARLGKRSDATLDDIFKGRNPYFLRSTRKAAFELVSYCLDNYLLSADESLFASFSRELSAFAARHNQQVPEPAAIMAYFAQDDLPLRVALLEEYDRAINRLTHQFLVEFCDADGVINWEQLTRFIVGFDAAY